MKKAILLIILILTFGCQNAPKNTDAVDAVTLLETETVKANFKDECVGEYPQLNPRTKIYDWTIYPKQNWGAKLVVFGDSIMDWAKERGLFTDSETLNMSIYGSNGCDFLLQVAKVPARKFETVVIGTMDYNGRFQGVSHEVTMKTMKRVVETAKAKFNPDNMILIGIHPNMNPVANAWKNEQNRVMKQYAIDNGYCFIDTVEMMGLGENDMPDPSIFLYNDGVHYNETIYAMVRQKIITQCGVTP